MPVKTILGASVCVIVIGNRSHVVIDAHLELKEFLHHLLQLLVEPTLYLVGRIRIVLAPHHHGHSAGFTLSYPAFVVLIEPLRHSGRFAQFTFAFAEDAHLTTLLNQVLGALHAHTHRRRRGRPQSCDEPPKHP